MVNINFCDGYPPISEEREGIGLVQNRVFMNKPIGMIKKNVTKGDGGKEFSKLAK